MQVSAHADHSVKALATQSTGHAMLQLRLTKGAYSAKHLQVKMPLLLVLSTHKKRNTNTCISCSVSLTKC